ncbi:PUA-like domain-containing protein [Aspergillus ambiguus]|uniref:PUA-like domain-containing protein n=1 Tax=Aspergillus ambiguus TaxID=176160 RepID=UPI003CCCA9C1
MPKRKSESAPSADEGSSPKRPAPSTGEKRKRGRPRKYPPGSRPQPVPGRGRGRPRKDPNAKDTPKPNPPKVAGRGRGRPRKSVDANGAGNSTEKPEQQKSESAEAKDEAEAEGEDEDEEPNEKDHSGRSYWLMKAEPESRFEKGVDVKFSIDDLRERTKPEPWDGVRNAVARNNIREMKKGDYAFFYHSNCKVPGIAGMMEIVQEHTPDESAFDPAHPYYDEKSTRENPKWEVVHVEFRRKFDNFVSLNDLKAHSEASQPLENLQVLKQSRLSVSRVSKKEWKFILGLAKESDEEEEEEEEEEAQGKEA